MTMLKGLPPEPLEQIHQREQCRVLIVLRTPTFPADMRLVGDRLLQHVH